MKYSKNIPLLGLVAVVAGILGVSTISSNSELGGSTMQVNPDNAKVLGHLTLIVKDKDGNIRQYRQTDNVINNIGFNCATVKLFGATTAAATCPSAPGNFNVIGLSSATAAMGHDTTLASLAEYSGNGLAPTASSVTVPTTAAITGTAQTTSTTQVSNTFTLSGTSSASVGAAALQDSATTTGSVNLFAAQTFASAVSLNSGDSLTVNWQVSLKQ